MLRGKERSQSNLRSIMQEVDRAPAVLVPPRMIRYQANSLASYEMSGIFQQNRNARGYLRREISGEYERERYKENRLHGKR